MGFQLRVHLKPLGTIRPGCSKGFQRALNLTPIMARDANLSDSCTSDHCMNSRWALFGVIFTVQCFFVLLYFRYWVNLASKKQLIESIQGYLVNFDVQKTTDWMHSGVTVYLENDFIHNECNFRISLLLSGIPQLWW